MLLRGELQDAQVLPGLSRTLRLDREPRAFCSAFFAYYNHDHRHSGISYHTPASVHYGTAAEVRAQRAETLDAAYAANPARFRHRRPQPPKLPKLPSIAWINEPPPPNDGTQKAS